MRDDVTVITATHISIGLVQERRNSIANALELRLSCTYPSTWLWYFYTSQLGKLWPILQCSMKKIRQSFCIQPWHYLALVQRNKYESLLWSFKLLTCSIMTQICASVAQYAYHTKHNMRRLLILTQKKSPKTIKINLNLALQWRLNDHDGV